MMDFSSRAGHQKWTRMVGSQVCQISTLLVGVLLMASQALGAEESVVEGSTVSLFCRIDNKDTANFKGWNKDGVALYSGNTPAGGSDILSRITLQENDYSLVIQSVKASDAGTYRCQVTHDQVQFDDTVLRVWVAPGEPLISFSKTGNLYEDDEVDITCKSSGGNPPPTIRMYRNDVQVSGISADGATSTLTVTRKLTYDDNTAVFKCSAFNLVNTDNPKVTTTTRTVLYAPRLSVVPYKPLVMLRGESGYATCVADANPPPPSIKWKKDNVFLQPDSANLTFSDVREVQAGTYVCVAVNQVATREMPLQVQVQYSPTVTVLPAKSTYRENDEISITCNYQANPPPASNQIVWYKRGTEEFWPGRTLHFNRATKEHNGTYSCKVTNQLQASGQQAVEGTGSATAEIVVEYAPGKASLSGEVEVVKGERAQFTCSSDDVGVPPANYRWRKQGSATTLETGPSYVIMQTTLDDDGVYECVPFNDVGDGPMGTITMTILERPEWTKELPQTQTAKVTDPTFSMTCEVRAKPEPEVTWQKDGLPLETDYYEVALTKKSASPNSFVVTSVLHFKGLKRIEEGGKLDSILVRDSGNYTCQARNTYGDIKSTGKLVINYRPVIDRDLNRVATDLNESATITCYAHALPKPTFRWFYDGRELTHDGKTFLISTLADSGRRDFPYAGQLIVEGVKQEHLGMYRCESTNAVGSSTQNIELTLKTAPSAPGLLRAGTVTWESVELHWTPGFDGGYTQTFYVTYNDLTLVVPGSVSHKIISSLYPNTSYSINMYAKNQLGQSSLSNTITVRTKVLAFPPLKDVKFHMARQTVTFVAPNSLEYCVRIDVSKTNGQTWENFALCESPSEGSIKLDSNQYNLVNVSLCLGTRQDICAGPPVRASKVEQVEEIPTSTIIIVGCVCGAVILILTVIFIVLCIRRRRPPKEYPDRPHMRPNSLPTNARAFGAVPRKNGGMGVDNPGMDSMERADNEPIFMTNSSPYGNGHANGIPYEMNDMMYNRDDFNSIDKKNLKNLPNVHNYSGEPGVVKLDDSSGSHPESGYSTPDPTKPKKVIYEVVV